MGASSAPQARKHLGQHFLIDPNIVRKIIACALLQPEEPVLEIGPGRGVLTRPLCGAVRRVTAIEIDRRLATHLKETLADCPNLDLNTGDALEYPYHTLPQGTVVVANLPYYLSTPLLFKLLEARSRISRMVLMLQTEVANRLVAKPGTPDYGVLSVLIQQLTDPSREFKVAANCFRPRPAVGSSVIKLAVRPQGRVHLSVADQDGFVEAVRAAFSHRRKTLGNSLRDAGLPPNELSQALALAGLDSTRRAETLTVEEFGALADALVMRGAMQPPSLTISRT